MTQSNLITLTIKHWLMCMVRLSISHNKTMSDISINSKTMFDMPLSMTVHAS